MGVVINEPEFWIEPNVHGKRYIVKIKTKKMNTSVFLFIEYKLLVIALRLSDKNYTKKQITSFSSQEKSGYFMQ